jgi:hypothetical protein
LPPLLFRLENSPDPSQLLGLADAVLSWFARHPGFQAAQKVFVELLGAAMAPLGPGIRVPEKLLEVRNMLATRMEAWLEQSKQQWLLEGEKRGEAALLLRQLERRFGILPASARERVLAADTVLIEEWALRLLEATSLDEVLA